MSNEKVMVVACDMVTAYGKGVNACWEGLLSGRSAVSKLNRFSTESFISDKAATIDGLEYHAQDSLVIQMLKPLFSGSALELPPDTRLILATAKGEIDLLEKQMLSGGSDFSDSLLCNLLEKVSCLTGIPPHDSSVLSAACTSSTAAVARAAAMIRCGKTESVLVVACDSVTEFVYSGFSSLMGLDPEPAKPFDKNRSGLTLGEAAAYALLMSPAKARSEKKKIIGEVVGWGMSNDANHMTGPSRDGKGLALAIEKSFQIGGTDKSSVGSICAHGTGTLYNDAMEMKAFRKVFNNRRIPTYSIKGGIGHTTGAAGLAEMIISLKSLQENKIPPTVNLKEVSTEAQGWISSDGRIIKKGKLSLSTNSGFGGVNAALVLRAGASRI